MRGFVKRAVALAFGLVLAAGLAEIVVRVAARYSSDVRYLATAGVAQIPRAYASLDDFLGEWRANLVPHRNWHNYYSNALGFTDREFSVEKPKGARRVMGLGDSFLFGHVAYSQNVWTLVGASLRAECPQENIETMNFGMPAATPWEYRLVHKFAAPIYKPDVVVVHFYMGNDGPDMILASGKLPPIGASVRGVSYAWNYLLNATTVLRSVRGIPGAASRPAAASVATPAGGPVAQGAGAHHAPRGGERASERPEMTDADFPRPLTAEGYAKVKQFEISRLYGGRNTVPPGVDAWKETIDVLEALRAEVIASTGRPPIMVLSPSHLQVYPEELEAARRAAAKEFPFIDAADFDPAMPSRVVMDYCRRAGLACDDLTPAMRAAAAESTAPLYLDRDGHWNIRGNKVAAAAEAALLRQQLCGPAGEHAAMQPKQ